VTAKRVLALLVVGASCAVSAGCDISPPAATVDGVVISQTALKGQLTQASSPVAVCALTVQEAAAGRSLPGASGSGSDTVSTSFAAFVLDRLVQQVLEQRTLQKLHATVGPGDVAAARQDFESQIVAAVNQVGSPCNLTADALVARLPAGFVDSQAVLVADQERLESVAGHVDVSPAALRAYYASHTAQVTDLCLDLIVATNQTAALAIHDQIVAGTSFATAAQSSGAAASTPPQAQGPCLDPSTLRLEVGAANAAPIEVLPDGGVAPPEQINLTDPTTGVTAPTWVVFGVRQHQLIPFDTAASALRRQLLSAVGSTFTSALNRVARASHVVLDPRYGTWSLSRGVTAPPAPPAKFVLNAAAAQGGTGAAAGSASP
jgi:hypothetical protein